jgi:hypothetical protein
MKKRILILAANPKDTDRLRLEEEIRELENILEAAKYRDKFELKAKLAVRRQDLHNVMLKFCPNIVIFSGHGSKEGIILEDDAGKSHTISPEALADFFSIFVESVECVILNACYTEDQARGIARHIPYVMGMREGIDDKLAIKFSTSVVAAIVDGWSYDDAFKLGRNAIWMHEKNKADMPKHLIPVLIGPDNKEELPEYDIFISYNYENVQWVKKNLVSPLLQCKTNDNKRPRIFFDEQIYYNRRERAAERNIYILKVLKQSRHIIPVYTKAYFAGQESIWEHKKILDLDPFDKENIIHPVLAEPDTQVPYHICLTNYITINDNQWFVELVKKLNLHYDPSAQDIKLVFKTQPEDIAVHHTLPSIEIAVEDESGTVEYHEEITIAAEKGELEGTKVVKGEKGKGSFSDLSFNSPVESTRLRINATGCKEGYSRVFSVKEKQQQQISGKHITDRTGWKIVLFEDGTSFALFNDVKISLFSIDGTLLKEVAYSGKPRLIKQYGDTLAVLEWSGKLLFIKEEGTYFEYVLDTNGEGFTIPGDVIIYKNVIYAGFWNGMVYRILPPDHPPSIEYKSKTGVQKINIIKDTLIIGDLEGKLSIIQKGNVVQEHQLEQTIHSLEVFDDFAVVVGREKLYQVHYQSNNVFNEKIELDGVSNVLSVGDDIIMIDPRGKGLCYSKDLIFKSRFHTKAGAVPESSDREGEMQIFCYPDRTRILMNHGRIIYSNAGMPMVISPRGEKIVLCDEKGINVFETMQFLNLNGEMKDGKTIS